MVRRPPRFTPSPYTTLFRSLGAAADDHRRAGDGVDGGARRPDRLVLVLAVVAGAGVVAVAAVGGRPEVGAGRGGRVGAGVGPRAVVVATVAADREDIGVHGH